MIIILKSIPKSADKVIKNIEEHLQGVNEIYIDKKINRRIEREISHLGKEKLIVDHISNLSKKFNEKSKNKILFLLVKLYIFNKQIHQSLLKELKNDKKLLKNRIKIKIDKNKAHKDIYEKLLNIANRHFQVVNNYAKTFNPKKKYSRAFILNIVAHKRRAETIYKALINVKMRKTMHKVLLKKLDKVYQAIISSTVELANKISQMAEDIKSDKLGNVGKRNKEVQTIVSDKISVLRDFAYKYTYNIIHSNNFVDFDGNKLILVTRHDHRHLVV